MSNFVLQTTKIPARIFVAMILTLNDQHSQSLAQLFEPGAHLAVLHELQIRLRLSLLLLVR